MLYGTDTSAYQRSVPAGDFAVLKATEGLTYRDAPFPSRWKLLHDRGTPRGTYHFAHPSEDPIRQAEFFLSVVDAAGLQTGDRLVLDHEALSLAPPRRMAVTGRERENRLRFAASMPVSTRAQWAQEWCAYVTRHAWAPWVYTFLSFAQAGNCAGLGGYGLWIADPSSPAGRPRVPGPWKTWVMHQYSSTSGIDRDVFNGTKSDWLATSPASTGKDDTWFLATSG
ncbi:GH25 family lysozyme [Actinoallomurus sp. NPDC052274]|uniref:glycoside hydrolase family 25 protein n=1 Tax=Actinoallomurus sp. NPDC052274 TaxID=3155420 RepID=UPI00343A1171